MLCARTRTEVDSRERRVAISSYANIPRSVGDELYELYKLYALYEKYEPYELYELLIFDRARLVD